MTFRKIISLSIGVSFGILLITGILSYFNNYSRSVATIHTVFGMLFSFGVLFHFKNNFRSIKNYANGKPFIAIIILSTLFFLGAMYQITPFNTLMNFGAKQKSSSKNELNHATYEFLEMNTSNTIQLTIDVLRAEHYWHPQMAVWIEDMNENYIETLFVSKATAKGLFFGGRSKANFKSFDENKNNAGDYRRVNALPVWSHKRHVKYKDGFYVPPSNNPLPDAITGATLVDNFKLKTSIKPMQKFQLKIELNVAFDDNEYYSEYDFPDDDTFHNGTGQLGQPSIVFQSAIDMQDGNNYYLMNLIGHGHQSGQNGIINPDLSTLTTAKEIIERIVVGVKTTDKL
ncbi:hypothetical protein [Spongiivirga citrea]|uniref:DUF4405 domain-containing protein n=1 Tax=Spongiivirga citrea TaxID=1481457 RepID=A0A6M0CKR4_9FLAO|nr:hypothetical protein [Spongiivirga citrea]NER16564.1 hypothetical protein [Spongiivirga citrea]